MKDGRTRPEEQRPTHMAEPYQGNLTAATTDSNLGQGPFQ